MDIDIERDIIAWCSNPSVVKAIHAFSPPVVHEAGVYHYHVHGQKRVLLRGLTRTMREALVEREPGSRSTGRKDPGNGEEEIPEDPAAFAEASLTGVMRGSRVHREVEDAILMSPKVFLRKYPRGMRSDTRRLLGALDERGWRPFKAEFIVYDLDLGIATRIDLLAVNREGRVLFVENKTGYGNGTFIDGPPGDWKVDLPFECTQKALALVQATMGLLMAVRLLRLDERAVEACVVQVDETALRWCPVPTEFIQENGANLYQHFALCNYSKRKS